MDKKLTDLIGKINNLPDIPGVYFFYNLAKELVYVGKATSLRDRVKSYFAGNKQITRPIEEMIREVADINYQESESVLEAIILEAIYIRKYKPLYNVLGKDDKSWNYIVITNEEYPRVETRRQHELEQSDLVIARSGATKQSHSSSQKQVDRHGLRPRDDNYLYVFGPYPGLNRQAAIKALRRIFHFSQCRPDQDRPCLYYQMGQCLGVCVRAITSEDYKKKVIKPLATFLSGKKKQLIKDLAKQMKQAGQDENFEEAARIRDQLQSLYRIHDVSMINESFFNSVIPRRYDEGSPRIKAGTTIQGDPLSAPAELPRDDIRIEGYDISNLGATNTVGGMVVFNIHGPIKNDYRIFNVKTVPGQSDVDALEEVLRRRLKHGYIGASLQQRYYWPLPDVILIDGGLPQVNRAKLVLKELGLKVPLLGIAKGPERKRNDFIIAARDPEFARWVEQHKNLLIQVRDEAHRFALSAHRRRRGRELRRGDNRH